MNNQTTTPTSAQRLSVLSVDTTAPVSPNKNTPTTKKSLRVGDFVKTGDGEVIAEGRFAKVFQGRPATRARSTGDRININNNNDELVAIKVYNKLDPEAVVHASKAIAFARRLQGHGGIMPALRTMKSGRSIYVVEPFARGGDLVEFAGAVTEAQARQIFAQLVDAVAYCHASGVAHRDIKAENVLMMDNTTPMLVDFGSACDVSKGDDDESEFPPSWSAMAWLSAPYLAPESIYELRTAQPTQHDPRKADVFALGVLLCFLLTGELPFPGNSPDEVMDNVLKNKPKLPSPWQVSSDASLLLSKLLIPDPSRRPTAEDVAHHPFCQFVSQTVQRRTSD